MAQIHWFNFGSSRLWSCNEFSDDRDHYESQGSRLDTKEKLRRLGSVVCMHWKTDLCAHILLTVI